MLIYKITNKINGKVYIGQTIQCLKKRWSQHKSDSKKSNMTIHKAMRKYGIENFTIEEIGGANNITELNYQEWLLIHKYNSLDRNIGYNNRFGGLNSKLTDKTKQKISKIAKKRKENPNQKKVINIKTGKQWSSAKECALECGMNYKSLTNKLSGRDRNNTNFRWTKEPNKSKPWIGNHHKKIINKKTGEIFNSISEAAKKNNIKRVTLSWKLSNPSKNNTNFDYFKKGGC